MTACAAEVCGSFLSEATLRTSPSSGQATTNSLLRPHNLPACHSGAALYGRSNDSKSLLARSILFLITFFKSFSHFVLPLGLSSLLGLVLVSIN